MKGKLILQLLLFFTLILPLIGCTGEQGTVGNDAVLQLAQNIKWLRSANPYGHTGVMIQTDDQLIYLDPVSLENREGLPQANIILVTHDHGDHFSTDMISDLSGENTTIVSISNVTTMFTEQNAISVAPGETVEVNGIEIEGIPAYNGSHAKALNHLGFVLTIDDVRVYCSGDTAFNPEMETLTDIDIAVMNVRNPYALSGTEIVNFAEMIKPGFLIPIHWMPENDTYQDRAEIEYIQQNISETTELMILELN